MKIEIAILLLSFLTSVVAGMIIIPTLKKLKVGQIERDDGPKSHLNKQGTPTMGGIIIILTMILLVIGISVYLTASGNQETTNKIIPILIATIGFGLIGFIDDFKKLVLKNTKGLKPSYKMLGLLIISVGFVIYLYKANGTALYLPIVKSLYIGMPVFIYIPFAVFVLLATTNAINLTDGIDGLASSVSTIIITALTVIAMQKGYPEISIFGSVVIGATLGFLMFNLHPAKVFMGDTGSLLLGGIIACMALYLQMPLLILIIALIPVIETLSVMIQVVYFKKTGGKRFFKMAPLHHHFELSGWKESKVVIVFSLITLLLCIIGINCV